MADDRKRRGEPSQNENESGLLESVSEEVAESKATPGDILGETVVGERNWILHEGEATLTF